MKNRPLLHTASLLLVLLLLMGNPCPEARGAEMICVPEAGPDGFLEGNRPMMAGWDAFAAGDFIDAAQYWKKAAGLYDPETAPCRLLEALFRLSQSQLAAGYYRAAQKNLKSALSIAESLKSDSALAAVFCELGRAEHAAGNFDAARAYLEDGLKKAKAAGTIGIQAVILNNIGNLSVSQGDLAEGEKAYAEAVHLAERDRYPGTAAHSLLNRARLALQRGDEMEVASMISAAIPLVHSLPDTHEKLRALIALADFFDPPDAPSDDPQTGRAVTILEQAGEIAERIGDLGAASMAWGRLGRIYREAGHIDEALLFTRRAIFAAQKAGIEKDLYRWHWQTGRLLIQKKEMDRAIDAYRRAAAGMTAIRQDLAAACSEGNCGTFRQIAGPLFLEFADLLLKRSAAADDPKEIQADLLEARETVEQMKVVELQDYFNDACVAKQQKRVAAIEEVISKDTAVVYPIIFPDRVELLVNLPGQFKRYTTAVDSQSLAAAVHNLRAKLQSPGSRYIRYSILLWDWLVAPYEEDFKSADIHTLIIVPDGPLRTLPLSALSNGEEFLIQRYALVTTPSLTLTDPRPLSRENLQVLANGLTKGVQGFNPLPSVASELERIGSLYRSRLFIDENFILSNIEEAIGSTPYSVVHIASHGQFDADPDKTFLLTYDDRLTMDRLEQLMGLNEFREEPVELLTLSACQTAVGDDRAALGLAGVAVKAGARSALATLWFVDDEATSRLVAGFYERIQDSSLSKAQALQAAQIELMKTQGYSHPAYWAPFLLIGNWM